MNLVLLLQQEVDAIATSGLLNLPCDDRRAKHIATVLKPEPGATIRVGVLDGGVGRASVRVAPDGGVELRAVPGLERLQLQPGPEPPHLELLLAMPRPKVMMRLWSTLSQLGLRRIVLTNACRVEKPYFSSQATDPAKYRPELLEGLEQAVCTKFPDVRIELRLKPFMEDHLEALCPSADILRLLCHPGDSGVRIAEAVAAARSGPRPPRGVLLAVGPEGGWVDYELQLFRHHGFQQVTLGSRIFTTEVALISLASLALDALAAPGKEVPATQGHNGTAASKDLRSTAASGSSLLSRIVPCCS